MKPEPPGAAAWLEFQRIQREHEEQMRAVERDGRLLYVLSALLVLAPLIVVAGWKLIGLGG